MARKTPREALAPRLAEAAAVTATTLVGSDTLQASYQFGDQTVQLGDIVKDAFEASGLTVDAWNALAAEARDELLNAELAKWTKDVNDAADDDAGDGTIEIPAGSPASPGSTDLPQLGADSSSSTQQGGSVAGGDAGGDGSGAGPEAASDEGSAKPDAVVSASDHYSTGEHPLGQIFTDLVAGLEQLPQSDGRADLIRKAGVLRGWVFDHLNGQYLADVFRLPELPRRSTTTVKVTGPKRGRWRIGQLFGAEARTIEVNDDELAAIAADPALQHAVVDDD